MRIAQLAPLTESVSPQGFGDTERMVSYLAEELIRLGHDITVFASGDSSTAAPVVSVCRTSLRGCESTTFPEAYLIQSLERAFRIASNFDIFHSHVDFFALPWSRYCSVPLLTTLHGRLDLPEYRHLYALYKETPLVSISQTQRSPLPHLNWMATVPPGLPKDLYQFQPSDGEYLAFLGRLSMEKHLDHAIEIAKRAATPLKIAAKVDPVERKYSKEEVEPLLNHPLVEFVGEITDHEKRAFLGNAKAVVAPCDESQAFGLILIEALACGTPILAYRKGAAPEIIDHNQTGFICNSLDEMIDRVTRVKCLSRSACRESFEAYFTSERMAKDYLFLYERACESFHSKLLNA